MARTDFSAAVSKPVSKSGKAASADKRKSNAIKIGIIVVCFAGAGIAYVVMSQDSEIKVTPQIQQAQDKAAEIQKQMDAAHEAKPEPPPPPLTGEPGPNRMRKAPGS